MIRNREDGRVHFSELKQFARSPAHYRYACEHPKGPTRAMTVGAVFDALVLGGRKVSIYPGKVRNGREWVAFESAHAGYDICIQSEYDEAATMAEAVLRDPVAKPLLATGEKQRVLHWEWCGMPCAAGIPGKRGGFDILGDAFLADLKAIPDADPDSWMKHAIGMKYHAQLAFYRGGAESIGHKIKHGFLIGVEAHPPNVVTVLELDVAALDHGEKSCRLWMERLIECERSDHWPGYVQYPVPFEIPEWDR